MRLLVKRCGVGMAGIAAAMISTSSAAGIDGAAPEAAPTGSVLAAPLAGSAHDLEAAIEEIRTKLRSARRTELDAEECARLSVELTEARARAESLAGKAASLETDLVHARDARASAAAELEMARTAHAELAARLRAMDRDSALMKAAAEQRERAVEKELKQRDLMVLVEQEQRRAVEAAAAQSLQGAVEQEAAAAAEAASLRVRLQTAEQDLARMKLLLAERDRLLADLEERQGRVLDQQQVLREQAELKQRVDQLIAERDKALAETAVVSTALETRLEDADRQLKAMGEEVRQAWADRAAAERRIEQVSEQAAAERAESARVLETERVDARTRIAALGLDLGRTRARAAALDDMAASIGMRAATMSAELDKMHKVATEAVAQATENGHQLLEALAEVARLSELVSRVDLVRMMSPGAPALESGIPTGSPDAFGRLKGQVWPVVATAEAAGPAPGPATPSLPLLRRLSGLALEPAGDGWIKAVAEEIAFVQGGDSVGPHSDRGLEQVAILLQLTPNAPVRIVGHTDSQGDEEKNRALSERRAASLRDILVDRFEIDPARITVEGLGSAEPVASNRTASGRSANRRVELFVAR